MNASNPKYQTLMANLLNIDTLDSSLFSSIDNEKYFDVLKSFGEETFDKIYKNFHFDCILTEVLNKDIAKKVHEAKNKTEVIAIFKSYNKIIDESVFKLLSSNFEKAKNIIVAKQETEFQKSIVKWKKILNKAQNMNIETNIWPLHIGFLYISIKTEKKTIYAPLFFKEIVIEVKNSLVHLHSNSDVRLNSKLVTFLNQEGFSLNIDSFDLNNLSIEEIYEYLKKFWAPMFKMPESLKSGVENLDADHINNTSIKLHPGLVLGFYNVSSGYLWNQMKKIIERNEFDEILNPNFNKNLYREKVRKVIFDDKFKLFKIQETNFSQDVATVSSLYQDTIIWGPPGTGKSQTITNLIVNVISRGYTALVVSQKKAALDVLRSRLKKISIFCLFTLNDKNLRSETFYEPLREFLDLLEFYDGYAKENGIPIFSDEDEEYVKNVNSIKQIKNLDNIINFYSTVMNGNFSKEIYEILKSLDPSLNYAIADDFFDKKSVIKKLYELNFNKKHTIFSLVPKIIKNMAELLVINQTLSTIDINQALRYINHVTYEEITQFEQEYKKILINKTIDLNDDKKLVKMLLEKTFERMKNFDDLQKTQYNAFAMAIRTGHLKPYKFFHKHKEMIKLLFPVIVTTPELDLSMWNKQEFDYVILDESSQMYIEKGIPLLYLGKRKVLAGDNQQMQPTRWFSATYNFDEEDDFGNIESLLDYAKARGVYSILLDKNYRSKKATLMTFSSKHFYQSKLDVIDDYEVSLSNDKAIEVFQVDGQWDNSMNEAEGKKVIELAKNNLNKYEKIIILVFNIKQQEYLVNKIFGNEPLLEKALMTEKIVLKNIENIQGDEADLVIMSVVYDKNTALYNTYVARKGGKNALNVAISRAKEKIFVVKSIYSYDIEINERSTADMIMFKEWLEFLDLSLTKQKNYLDKVEDFLATKIIAIPEDLKFKVDVLTELKSLLTDPDFEFQSNYSIGTKTIDIVLINKINNKLVQGFILDNFSYGNNYRDYLIFKDNINFLISKKYPIITISEIKWPIMKKQIFNYIKTLIASEQKNNQIVFANKENNSSNKDALNVVNETNEIKIDNESEIDNFDGGKENMNEIEDDKKQKALNEIDDFYVEEKIDVAKEIKEIDAFEKHLSSFENNESNFDDIDTLDDEDKSYDIEYNETADFVEFEIDQRSLENNRYQEPEDEDHEEYDHISSLENLNSNNKEKKQSNNQLDSSNFLEKNIKNQNKQT
ncbi:DEAD/DEAH box helicase [Metamycoplasma alkalescens]|uniref:Superfamily I DNA and/or RNA helicase n=4 Tax=Metamycoplasma alkalescens TaxID=45363 RepID=A0A318U527_9BACT|nr:DEAD/DEAH box helicase [Metamycoplasma alkalescens]PYF43109.1 superfamily I DNA and/or RNA helicase [Metamycoplasma alkalescens]